MLALGFEHSYEGDTQNGVSCLLKAEAGDRKKELQATLSQEIHMLDQAESLKKQFGLLSMKAGEMEQRALRAEERANKSEENE